MLAGLNYIWACSGKRAPKGKKSKLCSQPSNDLIPIEKYVILLVLKSVWEYLV